MRSKRALMAMVGLICLFFASALPAETWQSLPQKEDDREVVGLVLSGGGAKGAAHVGVIEILEELDVEVDFIVGASMGAIVGGMYASGVSPQEMRQRFAEIDWAGAFNDQPDRKHIPFRRKEDDLLPLAKLEFGIDKHGMRLPSGLVAGQKLNFLLRTMLIHATGTGSFNNLPIPFRAIAADLDNADVVVLDHGDLAKALRASMAFPLLFTPVEIEGRTLVDGGVLRNIPVDIALEMGADRLIVVDVSAKLQAMEKDLSGLGITRRTVSMTGAQNREAQLALLRPQDLLIAPDLTGLKFESFDKSDVAIERGKTAAQEHEAELRTFSVPKKEFESYIAKQREGREVGDLTLDFVEVTGVEQLSPKLVQKRIKTRPGDRLDLEILAADLERVYKSGEFETVEFRLEERGDSTGLVIEAREKSWGPWFLRPGLSLATDFSGRGSFFFTGLLRRPRINRFGAEWKSVLTFGSANLFFTEFFQPVEPTGRFFVAPLILATRNVDDRFQLNGVELSVDRRYATFGLDGGYLFGNAGEIRLGLRGGEYRGKPADYFPEAEADLGAFRIRAVGDRLDNVDFPETGNFGFANLWLSRDSLGADDEFERLLVEFTQAGTTGRFTFLGTARYGSALNSDLPIYAWFDLGGLFNLSGTTKNRYIGSDLGFARLVTYRKLGNVGGIFGGDSYLGISLEAGNAWRPDEDPSFSDLRPAGAVFFGVNSILGPVYAGWGLAEGGESSFYFALGRLFGKLEQRF